MHQSYKSEHHPLVRRLECLLKLDAAERDAVEKLPVMVREFNRYQDIARQGDCPSQCCLVLDGCVFRYKTSKDAKRQLLAFHFPGDIPDLQTLYLETMDYGLAALTRATIGFVQHRTLSDFIAQFPRIKDALCRDTLVEASISREWILNIGTRNSTKRLLHLLAEVFIRLRSNQLSHNNAVFFPVTQEELADALGITSVHVNRTLQEIRGLGLVKFERGLLEIPNWDAMANYCDFDDTYLHMKRSG